MSADSNRANRNRPRRGAPARWLGPPLFGLPVLGLLAISAAGLLLLPAAGQAPGAADDVIPDLVTIRSTVPVSPPGWAVLERELIEKMSEAALRYVERYTRPGGTLRWKTTGGASPDDLPEAFYNLPLLYALGGDERLKDLSFHLWSATARQLTYDFPIFHNEFAKHADWMHLGEGLLFFYYLPLADPTDHETFARAKRFAGLYMNEEPEAANYDAEHRIIRSPHTGSLGPRFGSAENARPYGWSKGMSVYGLPLQDLPGISDIDQLKDPANARAMGRAMAERMRRGDTPPNLAATSLAVNAYLFGGERKYADWAIEYTKAWLERTRANGGTTPDNIGLSGKAGEYHGGKWWGGNYGWQWPHGYLTLGMPFQIAAANAMLVTGGERGYLELPRSNIDRLIAEGKNYNGSFLVPYKHGDQGWFAFRPLARTYPVSLWFMSMEDADWQRVEKLRLASTADWHTATKSSYPNQGYANLPEAMADCEGCDIEGLRDWNQVADVRNKTDTGHEGPWVRFLAGENPRYPENILRQAYRQMSYHMKMIRDNVLLLEYDPRGTESIDPARVDIRNVHEHHWMTVTPVTTEALIQLTLGAPQIIYNGGLLHARLRYFDPGRRRPGLPPDVAALVTKIEAQRTVVELVNLSPFEQRRVILQAGMFGEHQFGRVQFSERTDKDPIQPDFFARAEPKVRTASARIDRKFFEVHLEPGTGITLDMETERFANQPSYAFPWHGDEIPIR